MITSFGPHRVQHGDVNNGIDALMAGDRAAIMYSDPPWGQGNIKYWATMNLKMNGAVNIPADLETFLSSVFGIAQRYVDRYLLIEYGVAWRDAIQARGVAAGFSPRGVLPLIYDSKNLPLDLHLFTKGPQSFPAGYAEGVSHTKGFRTLEMAIGPLASILGQGSIILDPCCGMGYTAKAAMKYGLHFRGNELNAARLAKTMKRLEKAA